MYGHCRPWNVSHIDPYLMPRIGKSGYETAGNRCRPTFMSGTATVGIEAGTPVSPGGGAATGRAVFGETGTGTTTGLSDGAGAGTAAGAAGAATGAGAAGAPGCS